jgi:hypothetical protein
MHALPLSEQNKQKRNDYCSTNSQKQRLSTTANHADEQNHQTQDISRPINRQNTTYREVLPFHSPLVRKVTNFFKQTNLQIKFRTSNTFTH